MGNRNRAALYHRVSTVDQNPNAARRELRAAARRMGLRVVLDLRETGKGTNNDRPGLIRVLRAAQRGAVDVVLVWKLDRFCRSAFDLLGNIRQLDAAGVRFVAVTQGIDIRPGGDSMSRLLLTMLAAVAEFERDLIVERTRLGVENARRAGKRLGRPPHAKPSVERVRQLRTRGASWAEVAERLRCAPPAGGQSPAGRGLAGWTHALRGLASCRAGGGAAEQSAHGDRQRRPAVTAGSVLPARAADGGLSPAGDVGPHAGQPDHLGSRRAGLPGGRGAPAALRGSRRAGRRGDRREQHGDQTALAEFAQNDERLWTLGNVLGRVLRK